MTHLSSDDTTNIYLTWQMDWLEHIVTSPKPNWGLICLRTSFRDNEIWQNFKDHISRWAHVGLALCYGTDLASEKLQIVFIEHGENLDGISLADMCR